MDKFFCCVDDDATEQEVRRIKANDPLHNEAFKYADNLIRTSKYTFLTFVPLNLFEQFQRLANFYFLCLLVLQLIPQISSLTPVTTAVPLITVLTLTAIKDAADDIQRHRSDRQVNNRLSLVLRNGKLVEERWHKVQVGDIIRMENDQFVAADLLLLSTSEPNGLCYIETAELDGESNLKCRQALTETAELGEDNRQIGAFQGEIVCEAPNNNLSRFEGTLTWKGKTFSLDNDKVLLRGCVLRNTKWCYGVVLFAGKDTKLMMNSGKAIFKRTNLDSLLNLLIIGIVFFLFSMCLFCTIACGIWESVTGQYFRIYLDWDSNIPKDNTRVGATVIALLVFFSYLIVLNTVVPISLYVSVEVIRFCHSLWINFDESMYYAPQDTPARARTTTLNEELGQIEYVFSDKTGTLTQNIMTFNKCSINGIMYGDVLDEETKEPIEISDDTKCVDFSENPYYETDFKFYDKTLLDEVKNQNPHVHEFFRILALCHTVMAEEKEGRLEYQAQSPDEAALVAAARNFGFVFKTRTPNSITIEVLGVQEVYELLAILDFNNVRKRMSVIIRKDGKVKLYCKGADSLIFERLSHESNELRLKTNDQLNKYACEGLRTLCLAVKPIEDSVFRQWFEKFHEASIAMENRDEKVNALYEDIEANLLLVGATAIEDKLQDGVPQAIANMLLAGMKLWVLTGDKQETAINIGYSCHLLTDDLIDLLIVDGVNYEEVENQLLKFRDNVLHTQRDDFVINVYMEDVNSLTESNVVENSGFALVVNGHSLVYALRPTMEKLFLEVASNCKSVICCRATPLQKALVVDLIKRHKKARTLAIGDGANDVSMIKTAHIGVGISGMEGNQAVLASDYALAQFRYLERLLLVHGRWSYFRMAKFLRYFFYKNFSFTLVHFWFAFFCGFSAQTMYDPLFISFYNVFFTSLPVLALGIFDQDVNDKNSLQFPKLYTPGILNLMFNKVIFLKSVAHGLITSFTLFFVTYGSFNYGIDSNGLTLDDHQLYGTTVSAYLVLVVTAQIALDTAYWTSFNHFAIWGSAIYYFCVTFFINSDVFRFRYKGTFRKTLKSAQFWFTLFLIITILLVPVVAIRFFYVDTHPTLTDRIRLRQRRSVLRARPSEPTLRISSVRRSSRRSLRSSYAFSHQEGFGRLIMSGKIMRKTKSGNIPNTFLGKPEQSWGSKPTNHSVGARIKETPSTVEI